MFGNISHTWHLMGQSWEVLKMEKGLLILPLISGICCIIVCASFILPSLANDTWMPPDMAAEEGQSVPPARQALYYAKAFSFYFCNYLIIIYFNAAIVACAALRMQGRDPSVADGLRIAASRFHSIIGWALVSATVGLLLRIIEDKHEKIGAIIASLLGTAWTLVTFLVLPVLVVEGAGPVEAFKKSARLLRETWGAQLAANFSFGLIFFLLFLPGIGIVALGVMTQNSVIAVLSICAAILYFIILYLVQSTLTVIFQTALYSYANTGIAPRGFDETLLRSAVRSKSTYAGSNK